MHQTCIKHIYAILSSPKNFDFIIVHQDKAYKCDQCDSAFFYSKDLRSHKGIKHDEGAAMKECSICKARIRPSNFARHVRVEHGDTKQKFSCTYEDCNAQYSDKQSLLRHKKKIHSEG